MAAEGDGEMIVGDVKAEIAAAVGEILGMRSFPYPQAKIHPPTFMTVQPEEILPHVTYARGVSTIRMPALLCVAKIQDRSSAKQLDSYLGMAGPLSVVRKIEDHVYVSCDSVIVASIAPDKVVTVGGIDHLGAEFTLDISGSGAT